MNTHVRLSGISGKSLLVFAGIVLLLGVVTGQAAAATVSGLVTNVTSHDPGPGVPNLFVVATTPAPNFTFLAQAQTDASGNYAISLPPMPSGTQFLVFVDPKNTGLVSDLYDTIEKPETFTGVNITGVNFNLVDGVNLSGKVTNTITDPDSPASGVIVFATNPSLGWKFLGQVTTGGDGTYGLLVPPNETAELAVDTQGSTVVNPPFIDVPVITSPVAELNFSLIQGVTVQGRVTDVAGNFISNALVEAFFVDPNVGWVWLGDDTTGLDGFYSVAVPDWGEILLRVTASGFVERRVEVVLDTNPKTRDIVLSTSVQISGRVTDASDASNGNPIAGVPVEAYFGDQYWWDATDSNGFYTLDVPPNQGFVTIHVDTTSIDYLQPGDGEVVVGIVDFTGIDFALTRAVRITGTVTDADANGNPPIPGAFVAAIQRKIVLAFDLTDGLLDPDPGKYLLKVAVNQGEVVIHVDAGTSYETADQLVTVAESPITQDFALNPVVQTDTVTIKSAIWSNNRLTVFAASSLQPNATLTAIVVKGGFSLGPLTMTFSSKRSQYELRVRVTTNLKGGIVTVTSSKGGTASATIQ